MKRENHINEGTIREYGNGNITLKYSPIGIDASRIDNILTLASMLDSIDCYFMGETYCLSNYETGHTIYNAHSDLSYIFPWAAINDLEAGKTIRLYARPVDDCEREIIEMEGI